jgi:hypothetical protein
VLLLATCLAVVVVHARPTCVVFPSGIQLEIKRATIWCPWGRGACRVKLRMPNGTNETVSLDQDFVCGPLLFAPMKSGRGVLCIYDAEICVGLVRILPGRPFVAAAGGAPDPLEGMVLESSCLVEKAGLPDWLEAREYLKQLSRTEFERQELRYWDFGVVRAHTPHEDWQEVFQEAFIREYGVTSREFDPTGWILGLSNNTPTGDR